MSSCLNCFRMLAQACSDGVSQPYTLYTRGPIDGSLYATVIKPSSKSHRLHHQEHQQSKKPLLAKNHDSNNNHTYSSTTVNEEESLFLFPEYENIVSGGRDLDQTTMDSVSGLSEVIQKSHIDNNVQKNPNCSSSGNEVYSNTNGKHNPDIISLINNEPKVQSNGITEIVNCNARNDISKDNNNNVESRSKTEEDELDELLSALLETVAAFPDRIAPSDRRFNDFEKVSTENNQSPDERLKAKVATEVHFPRTYQTDETDSVHFHSRNNKPSSQRISPDLRTSVQETTRRVPMVEEERKPKGRPYSYEITAGSAAIETTAYVCESTPTRVSQQNNNNNSMTTTRDHSVGADVDESVVIDDGASDVFSDYCHHPPHQQHNSSQGLTWLQRQQQKLKAKHVDKELLDRQRKEERLSAELREAVCKRMSMKVESSRELSPSWNSMTQSIHVRIDGQDSSRISVENNTPILSPKATLSRQSSAPIPPPRTSSRLSGIHNAKVNSSSVVTDGLAPQLRRQQSDTSSDRERPFLAIKRAQESQMHPNTNPQDALASLTYDSLYHNRNYQTPSISQQQDGLNQFEKCSEFSNKHNLSDSKSVPAVEDDSMIANFSLVDHSTPKKRFEDTSRCWSPSLSSTGSAPGSPSQTNNRPETPNFPITPQTPYVNANSATREYFFSGATSKPSSPSSNAPRLVPVKSALTPTPGIQSTCYPTSENGGGQSHFDNGSVYYGHSRRSSTTSMNETSESMAKNIAFVQDTSKYWYKPKISREEAIALLKDKPPGTFVVRDSTSFPGAFGLAIKVAVPPPNVQNKTGDISSELVRHFLIEPTKKGVQIKACANEHEFGSLPALISEHSVRPMSLPCKLIIPQTHLCPAGEVDVVDGRKSAATDHSLSTNMLVDPTEIGAACNVLYLLTVDTESLTGPQAVRKAVAELFSMKPAPVATVVHFKVSACGITLTDNRRRLFFRKHYVLSNISHCGLDPDDRRWENPNNGSTTPASRCFGFVARKQASKTDNQCHVFAEYETGQPATAIVNFMNRVLALEQQKKSLL